MIVYVMIKFIFFILSMTMPLPNGIFSPMISFGAVFGRMFGRALMVIGNYFGLQLIASKYTNFDILDEGMYAVVGAAAVYGSVTKTVSIAIIMFECLGQMELLLPVLLGVTVSYLCTSGMAMCIFDVLLEFKNFPFMPTLGSENSYALKASDIAQKNFLFLGEESILKDVVLLL